MELYFLRHAIAVERGNPKYKDDSLRPLTPEGTQKMRLAALGMQKLGLKFDLVLSSPYLRAKQTAKIVTQIHQLKNKKFHLTDNLLEPAPIHQLLDEIKAHFPKSKSILLVGHEPHLSGMVSMLLKAPRPLGINLKKGGLCCLSIRGKVDANLNWLLTPEQLGLLSK